MLARQNEMDWLTSDYKAKSSSFIVCYGRRRIGKSYLLDQHLLKKSGFKFEGIEGLGASRQIELFSSELQKKYNITAAKKKSLKTWDACLSELTTQLKQEKNKQILFFDEFQWMAIGRGSLVSLLKKYWDNDWKKLKLQIILCGSISSYMVQKVIKSKALYGRITAQLKISFLQTEENTLFFKKSISDIDKLKYVSVFGGIPKYLIDINQSQSFEQNIQNLFLKKEAILRNEYERIFYSQFKEHQFYEKIIEFLSSGPKNLVQIAETLKMKSGGGLKSYLTNLENAQFITSYYSNPNNQKSKLISYRVSDPLMYFHLFFIQKNIKIIENSNNPLETYNKIIRKKIDTYMGLAFENFCRITAYELAAKMNFSDKLISFGPFYQKNEFQIDLIYFRNDNVIVICEIKFTDKPVPASVIIDTEKKIYQMQSQFPSYTFQKALISASGAEKKLIASDYFDYILTAKEIMSPYAKK
jgi:uncharacterized protein